MEVTNYREDVSTNTKQGVKEAYDVLQTFETQKSTPNTPTSSGSSNTLVRERLNPRVATVPVEAIPVIATQEETRVDSYLHFILFVIHLL